jgi:hypothetical protein
MRATHMNPEAKRRLTVLERALHEVLSPLGFKKQKSNWRRTAKETLQQFSIVSLQLDNDYCPAWGLNLLNRSENPKPLPWKLQAKWSVFGAVKNLKERLRYLACFSFDADIPDAQRAKLSVTLLRKYVLPCFELYTTEEAVKRMMGDRSQPFRADSYWGLPDEWWPGGRSAAAAAAAAAAGRTPKAPIIRPWRPNGISNEDDV